MLIDKDLLELMRRVVIQLLCVLDDALGLNRTVPDKHTRYKSNHNK